jgi:aromatic-L-amino-acid decarboxylase
MDSGEMVNDPLFDGDLFRKNAHRLVDWMADYYQNLEQFPVKSQVKPGAIFSALDDAPPEGQTGFEEILADFEDHVLPGMTHWQHPKFFAYFPANASYPSLLGEMLTATLAAQCMIWETSPAAAEMEQRMMEWLRDMIGLPPVYEGVIQDTASAATLVALLTARERATDWQIRKSGFSGQPVFTIYASVEAHSSIEKAVIIAGFGSANLRKVPVRADFTLDPEALQALIREDRAEGKMPLAVVASFGTTGVTALDPLDEVADVCEAEGLWFHVDAAYAGSALVLPEFRPRGLGMERCDSFCFNPHKWMFTHFDCTAYFVRDKEALLRTFEILPEYLKTGSRGQVNDYRDWGVALGRRFRALKLWFVLRSVGLEGIRERFRAHIRMAEWLESQVEASEAFEIAAPRTLNLVCFQWKPVEADPNRWDALNQQLLETLNASGKMYLSHTRIHGAYTLRLVIGQTRVTQEHVEQTWAQVQETAEGIQKSLIAGA